MLEDVRERLLSAQNEPPEMKLLILRHEMLRWIFGIQGSINVLKLVGLEKIGSDDLKETIDKIDKDVNCLREALEIMTASQQDTNEPNG
ncbi:MAG: hypothetical protein L0346_09550 [Chloroflexi bacterium]|nr:hypothetical protein [Chloroflexota bacterium]